MSFPILNHQQGHMSFTELKYLDIESSYTLVLECHFSAQAD